MSESEFDDFFDLLIDHLGLEEALESSEDAVEHGTQNSSRTDKNDKKRNSSDSKDHDKERKDSGSGSSSISGSNSGDGGGLDDDVDSQNGREVEEDFGLGSASIIKPAAGQHLLDTLCCKVSL